MKTPNAETFDLLIASLDSGRVNQDVTRELRGLVKAIATRAETDGRAAGKLTVELTIAGENDGRIEIVASVKSKRPGPRRSKEVRWMTKDGALAVQDPRQETLPLRAPGAGTGVSDKLRNVTGDAAE